MDPSYQQMMAQQLMGQGSMAPGTTGQNASTPYGASFQTGNMFMPQQFSGATQAATGQAPNRSPYPGMLSGSAAQMLSQPMATYG